MGERAKRVKRTAMMLLLALMLGACATDATVKDYSPNVVGISKSTDCEDYASRVVLITDPVDGMIDFGVYVTTAVMDGRMDWTDGGLELLELADEFRSINDDVRALGTPPSEWREAMELFHHAYVLFADGYRTAGEGMLAVDADLLDEAVLLLTEGNFMLNQSADALRPCDG
jgi:hypothetical protein